MQRRGCYPIEKVCNQLACISNTYPNNIYIKILDISLSLPNYARRNQRINNAKNSVIGQFK